MITRFITECRTKFNPFQNTAKTCRSFLALLPPDARSNGMKIDTQLLPRTSQDKPILQLKFKDGKEMDLDLEKLKITQVVEEVDRHSRQLSRQAELTGN